MNKKREWNHIPNENIEDEKYKSIFGKKFLIKKLEKFIKFLSCTKNLRKDLKIEKYYDKLFQ